MELLASLYLLFFSSVNQNQATFVICNSTTIQKTKMMFVMSEGFKTKHQSFEMYSSFKFETKNKPLQFNEAP